MMIVASKVGRPDPVDSLPMPIQIEFSTPVCSAVRVAGGVDEAPDDRCADE